MHIQRRKIPGYLAALALTGCAAAADDLRPPPGHTSEDAASTSGSGGGAADGVGGFNPSSVGGGAGGQTVVQTPVRALAGLQSITFYETTSVTQNYTFTIDGPELSARLPDPLGTDFDIAGAETEYYDVYYSNADGEPDIDGSYLTISGVFEMEAPWGGGLNLAEIALNYSDDIEYGNYVASFVALGNNAIPADVEHCIDEDLQSYTTMGNTLGQVERVRLTLGFLSSSGPPPELQ